MNVCVSVIDGQAQLRIWEWPVQVVNIWKLTHAALSQSFQRSQTMHWHQQSFLVPWGRKQTADRLVVWGNTPTGSPLLLIEQCLWQQRARLKQYQTQKVKAVLNESSGVHIGKYVLETGFKRGKESEALSKTLNIYLWNKW